MTPLFWQVYACLILLTGIILLFLSPVLIPDIPFMELISILFPRLLVLLVVEAGFSYMISRLIRKPLNTIRSYLLEKEQNQGKFERLQKHADPVGSLARVVAKTTTQTNQHIHDLITQQRYLASILENLNDGICIVNKDGDVHIINQATKHMFDIPESAVSGQSLIETIRHYKVHELWLNCGKSGIQQTAQLETSLNRSYLQCIATPLEPLSDGNILLLFQDITRLHQLEIVRRDFVSNVSHELRTPLTSLKLITETLSDGAMDDPPAQKRFLKQMETEIDNLTQLVQELLELSRIESGLVPIHINPVHPQEIINEAAERMKVQAERAGLEYKWDCPQDLPLFSVDKDRLGQVLINLIHNAIKFTPPGGKVFVTVKQENNQIIFSVQDTGIGIPQKDIDRIFERFYKTDRSRSKSGTGLGLSIARHLVEAHHGKLWVNSTINKGSTFFFSIPIHNP